MPTGKVKFYDKDKGFGFAVRDDGGDVFIPKASLPAGVESLTAGMRLEFGVAAGQRGEQALSVRVLDAPPALASTRRGAEDLGILLEDAIKLLESKVQPMLRKGKHPDAATASRIAQILRGVADELDG